MYLFEKIAFQSALLINDFIIKKVYIASLDNIANILIVYRLIILYKKRTKRIIKKDSKPY